MENIYCPICESPRGFKRSLGFGTFFMVFITAGFWLLTLPLYPKRCIQCGTEWSNAKSHRRQVKREVRAEARGGSVAEVAAEKTSNFLEKPAVQSALAYMKELFLFNRLIISNPSKLREKAELPAWKNIIYYVVVVSFAVLVFLFFMTTIILVTGGFLPVIIIIAFAYVIIPRLILEGVVVGINLTEPMRIALEKKEGLKFKELPTLSKVMIIGVPLIIFFIAVGALSGEDEKKEEPETSAVATSTVPAKTTSTATAAPPPAPVPAGLTEAEKAYRDSILDLGSQYATAFEDIGTLSTQAGENSYMLIDETWKMEMAVALATVTVLDGQIAALSPPERFTPAHSHLLSASTHFDQMVALMAAGIDEIDDEKIYLAMAEMQQGTSEIVLTTEEIKKITG